MWTMADHHDIDTPDCDAARDDLELLAIDVLEPDRAAEVRAHVGGCGSCAAELALLEGVVASVLDLARPVPLGGELTERILAARAPNSAGVAAGAVVPNRTERRGPSIDRRRRHRARLAMAVVGAAAAALLIGVGAGLLLARTDGSDTTSSEERAGIDVVRTGVLMGWGRADSGTVMVTSGERPTLVVSLDEVRPGVTYGCQVRLADGSLVDVGSWTPGATGDTAWAVPLDEATASAVEVVLTGPDGTPVASAPLS
jgi:anti-sigma factor RsiW